MVTVLSHEEEDISCSCLPYTASSSGFPQDCHDIKKMVRTFCEKLDRENPFKHAIPGKE